MIEKLNSSDIYRIKNNEPVIIIKINEIIKAVNELEGAYRSHYELHHADARTSLRTPLGNQIDKLHMMRACLDDLEEEIRRGSI